MKEQAHLNARLKRSLSRMISRNPKSEGGYREGEGGSLCELDIEWEINGQERWLRFSCEGFEDDLGRSSQHMRDVTYTSRNSTVGSGQKSQWPRRVDNFKRFEPSSKIQD